MAVRAAETVWHGYRSLTLSNPRVELTVVPEIGAKVVSLVDRTSGREWLAQPRGEIRRHMLGDPFDESAAWGWDECFPSVAAGTYPFRPWEGTELPDHGELWSRPWDARIDGAAISASIDGVAFRYTFLRRIELGEQAGILVHYHLANHEAEPLAFIWSMHPLFAGEPGMRVDLGLSPATPLRVEWSQGFGQAAHVWLAGTPPWVVPPPDAAPQAVKLFTAAGEMGIGSIFARDGSVAILVDPARIPFFGVWLDHGGWPVSTDASGGLRQVGLEPTNAQADALWNGFGRVLRPRAIWDWSVAIDLGLTPEEFAALVRNDPAPPALSAEVALQEPGRGETVEQQQ